ncbi:SLAP domain-containing protein [Lederbergia galactosidilyticus]|uniref:SLAP domain-containing protein n=1 Tax=Lederbergia galactosidilytica TaxID=217031 RepID=UPI001AE70BBF|nr:SLAP domain-containing protein [Lederbergia galactosidilytica]MBP1913800.1 SLAP domain-containing protein [Lederbergia galactosidilytica]
MSTVHFHPVWDQQLTKNEKIQYIQKADSICLPKGSFSVTPLLTKYKRNGGLVATVFLHNGFPHPLQLQRQIVKVTDDRNETIAQGIFSSLLKIDPMSSQPWSFVFSKQMMEREEADLTTIFISVVEEEVE